MEIWSRLTGRSSSPGIKYHGLQNQGATCYLNSVLQVLFMTKGFRETLRRCRQNDDSFQTYLSILFETLEESESNTQIITQELGIRSGSIQADAAECFEKIMNKIKNEKASKMFKIWLTHKNKYDCCQKEKSTDEQFWHLPLELEEDYYYPFKVVDGLEMFFKESRVTGQDQLYCEDCQKKSDSRDKFEMKDHPEVLTLLLKRFKYGRWLKKYVKIERSVEVPDTITIESQKYELYAFVEHSGGLKVGHYTVTIKSEDDDKWYSFNDTTVTLLSYQPFQTDPSHRSRDAYLLFYRKEKKASSGDEASPPAASKQETCGLSDRSGNAVKTGEKEDEEATAGVKHVTESEGKRVPADEEREEKILRNGKIVSEEKDRSMTVDEGREKSPANVEEEGETDKRAAGDRKSAGEHKTNKKLQKKYDLVYSPPGNTTGEKSDTKHEEERDEENSQSKSIFHTDVQDTAAVNSDSNNDCAAKDETSGRDYSSEDQVKRARVEENHIHKPTDGRTYRSNMTLCLQSSYSSYSKHPPTTQKEERRERERFDGQTTESHQRYRSQTAEGQNKIQSGGNLQMRPQEDPKEEMRRKGVREKRYNREEEEMRDTMQSRRETAAEETRDSNPAEVDTLSKCLSKMNLRDSTPTEKPESRNMSTQTEDMNSPSALDTSSRNTAYVYWQSPQWVSYPQCGNCQSVIRIMPGERVLLTQTSTHPGLYPIGPEIPVEIHFLNPSQGLMQTISSPPTSFAISNAHNEVAQRFITGAEEQHVTSYSPEGSVMSNVFHHLRCRRGTDPS